MFKLFKVFEFLKEIFLSEDGGTEGQEGGSQEGGEGNQEGQSEAGLGEEQQQGEGEQNQDQQPNWEEKLNEITSKFESLRGKTTQTEKNLAATRQAIEQMGLRWVSDAQGNVHIIPAGKEQSQSRFTNDHRSKFASFFPNQEQAESFLGLLNAYLQDFIQPEFSKFDTQLQQRQAFITQRDNANERMINLYPSLDTKGEGFNKAFYDKATEIWESQYRHLPNGELIAANEAAIEMGIAPASVMKAEKQGFEKGKQSRQILSPAKGTQTSGQGGGFRKLAFDEFSKLSSDEKKAYNLKEIENRGR